VLAVRVRFRNHGSMEEGKTVGNNAGESSGSCAKGHWATIEGMRNLEVIDNH
jgi:hypothetical protein